MTTQKDTVHNEIKYLHKFVDFASKRVLEIGCGEGRLTWQYAKDTRSTTAVDLDADELRVAMIERPSDLINKIHFARADSVHLPFTKETFDIVLLAWSF